MRRTGADIAALRVEKPAGVILPQLPGISWPIVFLPRREVIRRVGLSVSTIYARMAAGTFPQAVHDIDTGTVWWLEHEIVEWQLKRLDPARVAGMGSCMGRN